MKKQILAGLFGLGLSGGVAAASDVDLRWSQPTTRTDLTPLLPTEIAGYTIAYRCGAITGKVEMGPVLSTVITNLSGECYFKIATRDTLHQIGPYSPEIMVVAQDTPPPPPPPSPIPEAPTLLDVVETVTIKWAAPTKYTNGAPLVLADIVKFDISHTCNNGTEVITTIVGNSLSTAMTGLYGSCRFKVKAYDKNNQMSDWSNQFDLLIKLKSPSSGGLR